MWSSPITFPSCFLKVGCRANFCSRFCAFVSCWWLGTSVYFSTNQNCRTSSRCLEGSRCNVVSGEASKMKWRSCWFWNNVRLFWISTLPSSIPKSSKTNLYDVFILLSSSYQQNTYIPIKQSNFIIFSIQADQHSLMPNNAVI